MDARVTEFGTADAMASGRQDDPGAAAAGTGRPRAKAVEEFLSWRKMHDPRLQPGDDAKAWINEGRR